MPGLELAAVCDIDAETADAYAAEFGCARTYTDWRAMVDAEAPDAIVSVTPIALTRKLAAAVLETGIPVLIEKPPGRTPNEARELAAVAAQTGTPHLVSFNRRFIPALTKARAWLQDRRVDQINARMLRVGRHQPDFIMETGIHLVDTVLSLLPAPATLSTSRRWTTPDGGQSCQGSLCSAGNSAATLTIAPDCGRHQETYEVLGPGFQVWIDAAACRVTIHEAGKEVLNWDADAAPDHVRSGAMAETEAFLTALRTADWPEPDLGAAAASVELTADMAAGRY